MVVELQKMKNSIIRLAYYVMLSYVPASLCDGVNTIPREASLCGLCHFFTLAVTTQQKVSLPPLPVSWGIVSNRIRLEHHRLPDDESPTCPERASKVRLPLPSSQHALCQESCWRRLGVIDCPRHSFCFCAREGRVCRVCVPACHPYSELR